MKKRVLTGDRATGSSYVIGAYIGTLKNRLDMQDEYDTFIFSADYHSLTTDLDDSKKLAKNAIELVKTQISIGIDPEKVTFYRQSKVPATFELHVILSMMTQMAELERQPALKEKLAQGKKLTYGLMGYPVLMAADILVVDSDLVPVAKDQEAHVEMASDLAKIFNRKFGKTIKVPAGLIGEVVIGLDGKGKSGKSTGGIFFSDSTEEVRKKVMSMYTDPNRIKATDPGTVDGNPVFIYHDYFNPNVEEVNDLKERYTKGTVGDVEVKEKLFRAVEAFLEPIREKKSEIDALGDDHILDILKKGEDKVNPVAEAVLDRVRGAMGF
ncbi:tryptophan--tRNA ligase [Candidatus Dojkabacteria bacterium]|uniref:Tryptophan--tRNA ligase n=1 Tax=Candidatus Dojkabacteria bacterium TaxID=2099670 RepID=A0A955I1L6_9BACT|nr:tryptophan--tRNA ligase [Candidatus Dojkabacteria bacterium]